MGGHAIALLQEVEHLGVPVVAAQWPAMVEYDRLRPLRGPILVENRRSVTGCNRRHSTALCLPARSPRERPLAAPISAEQRRSRTAWNPRPSLDPFFRSGSAREPPPDTCDSKGCVIAF